MADEQLDYAVMTSTLGQVMPSSRLNLFLRLCSTYLIFQVKRNFEWCYEMSSRHSLMIGLSLYSDKYFFPEMEILER